MSLDLDVAFVSAVVAEGKPALRAAIEKGITKEHLLGEGADVYEFLCEYLKKYKELPTLDMIEGQLDIRLPEAVGKADFFADAVLDRRLQTLLIPKVREWGDLIEKGKSRELYIRMEEATRSLRQEARAARVEELTAMGDEVWEEYLQRKAGVRGIPLPWPSLDDALLGLWPEDLGIFVARTGVGKTWSGLMIARHAWMQGKRVLFVTTEMSRINVATRFVALHLRLPYYDFRRGRLGEFAEVRVEQEIKALLGQTGFQIVGGGFDFTFPELDAAIDEAEPDLLILDGAYLLRGEGISRTERAASSADEMKRVAQRNRLATVATLQFNRSVKGGDGDTISLQHIAMTDAASWNATFVVGLNRTEDQRRDGQLEMILLKARENALTEPVKVCWDFQQMKFDEIGKGGGDADEFGTGLTPAAPVAPAEGTNDPFAPF